MRDDPNLLLRDAEIPHQFRSRLFSMANQCIGQTVGATKQRYAFRGSILPRHIMDCVDYADSLSANPFEEPYFKRHLPLEKRKKLDMKNVCAGGSEADPKNEQVGQILAGLYHPPQKTGFDPPTTIQEPAIRFKPGIAKVVSIKVITHGAQYWLDRFRRQRRTQTGHIIGNE